jgi:biopolymer transport protein ExbD
MGFLKPRPKLKEYRIELIPLIDIVFTLLIFFAVTSTFIYLQKGIELELPRADSAGAIPETVTVGIDRYKEITLNQDRIPLAQLKEKLQPLVGVSPTVILMADKELPYETIVQVMDKIRLSGCSKIVLKTQQ